MIILSPDRIFIPASEIVLRQQNPFCRSRTGSYKRYERLFFSVTYIAHTEYQEDKDQKQNKAAIKIRTATICHFIAPPLICYF